MRGQAVARRLVVLLTLWLAVVAVTVVAATGAAAQADDATDCHDPDERCTVVWVEPGSVAVGDTVEVTGYTRACTEPGSGTLTLYGDFDYGDGAGGPTGDVLLGPVPVSGDYFETTLTVPAEAAGLSTVLVLACSDGSSLATTGLTVASGSGSGSDAPPLGDSASARVEGEYHVVQTLESVDESHLGDDPGWQGPGDTREQTMVATPLCPEGACDVELPFVSATPSVFAYDGSAYRLTIRFGDLPDPADDELNDSCTDDVVSTEAVFTVTGSEERGGVLVATELTGSVTRRWVGWSGGEDGAPCELLDQGDQEVSSFVATLVSAPVPQPVDDAEEAPPVAVGEDAAGEDPVSPGTPVEDALPGGVSRAQFDAGRPHVVGAVTAAAEAPWDAGSLALAALLAMAMVLLIVFPSELFNSTLDEHYEQIRDGFVRRIPWLRARVVEPRDAVIVIPDEPVEVDVSVPSDGGAGGALRRGWLAFVGVTAASALLYGLLDPGFGANSASAVLLIGVASGVAVATLLSVVTSGWLARRRFGRSDYYFRVLPATLLVAAACVAVSRMVGFLPGYLYGLVGGIAFRQALDDDDEARTVLVSSVVVLVAAVAGWLAYGPVAGRIESGATGFGWLALESILAGTFIAGVEGLLFGLVPLRFLAGHTLWKWSKAAWAATYGTVAFAFVHLVARPAVADDAGAVSWTKTLALFVAFGLVSVGFWAYWRRRDQVAEQTVTDAAPAVAPPDEEPVAAGTSEPS